MALAAADRSRAPVVFGLRAVPRLFEELQRPEPEQKTRALNSLCDLLHEPERLYQTVTSGLVEQLSPLLRDSDSGVRTRTCDLLHLMSTHTIGRHALLSSSLLGPLSLLIDDPDPHCRVSVHRVLNHLALLPSGAEALLSLVPKLMLKLKERGQETDEGLGGKRGTEELGMKRGTKELGGKGGTEDLGRKGGTKELGGKRGTEELGMKRGTKELGGKRGTEELGMKRGTKELGGKGGTEELGRKGGTKELGGKGGTEELGGKEGTEELGMKEGTEELGRKEGIDEGEKKGGTEEELGSKEAQEQGGSKEGAEETGVEDTQEEKGSEEAQKQLEDKEATDELGSKGGAEERGSKEAEEEGGSKDRTEELEVYEGDEQGSKEVKEEKTEVEGEKEQGENKMEEQKPKETEPVEEQEKEGGDEEGTKEQGEEGGGEQGDTKEEELVLLLSTLARCSHLDALPALASDGVELLQLKLTHGSAHVRREAAAAMLALSVPVEGKQQICALDVLSDLLTLLHDPNIEVRTNAAGVCMNTLIITAGKVQGLKVGLLPVLLDLVSPEDLGPESLDPNQTLDPDQTHGKALVLYCLRALTALSEAPAARCLLMEQRPRLERRRDTDPDLRQATETALRVISWTP